MLASNLAAKRLIQFMNDDKVPYPTRLAAARDLLDRADLAGVSKLEVELPFMATMHRAIRMNRPGGGDPEVIDADVVAERPAIDQAEHFRIGMGARGNNSAALISGDDTASTLPRPKAEPSKEPHVNSDDTPPEYVRRKTPGYANMGGQRRTPTRIER